MVPTQEKDFEIPEGGIIMITMCIIKTEVEVMMMKMAGTKILDQIMMILVTPHMEVDREEKKTELVETKVDLAAPREEVVEEIVVLEGAWEVVALQNEGHMRTAYPTRKSHFHATVSHKFLFFLYISEYIWGTFY